MFCTCVFFIPECIQAVLRLGALSFSNFSNAVSLSRASRNLIAALVNLTGRLPSVYRFGIKYEIVPYRTNIYTLYQSNFILISF